MPKNTSAPDDPSRSSFTIHDLASAAKVSVRSVRTWIRKGLLPHPELHGWATTYDRSTMLRVRAIRRLRSQGEPLALAKFKLQGLTDAALEAMLAPATTTPPAAAPPPPAPTASALPSETPRPTEPARDQSAAAPTTTGEAWRRHVLVSGLELFWRDDAGQLVDRLAAEIVASYAARSGD
jgi:DNA-binding transcriptional MerR regulator